MKPRWLLFAVLGLISLVLWEISQPSRWHNLSATQLERAQRIEEARRKYGHPAAGPGRVVAYDLVGWDENNPLHPDYMQFAGDSSFPGRH